MKKNTILFRLFYHIYPSYLACSEMIRGFLIVSNLLLVSGLSLNAGQTDEDSEKITVPEGIYYKNDQGFTWGILMDQRMSNLHYEGPGGIINLGRRVHRSTYISEWSFARIQFNYSRPAHKNTIVANPGGGLRYLHLRKVNTPDNYEIFAGGEANLFGNFRIADRLGNSFLFADFIAELRPQAGFNFGSRFLWRDWNIELSLAASLGGYAMRIPEYGVSFELDEDGGIKIQGFEQVILTPFNYSHVTTGIFVRESFSDKSNPNWFRIGYIWDYYTMAGEHSLNMNNTQHQLVLELYFKVK